MLERLQARDEREVRRQKTRIYKQILDNQLFLNQEYRRKQQQTTSADAH